MVNLIHDIEEIVERNIDNLVSIMILLVGSNMEDGGNRGGQNTTNKIRVQSGKLLQSFEKGTKLTFKNSMIEGFVGSDLPYAKVHEDGEFIKTKGKMANFFLAMYIKTKDLKWLYMRKAVLRDGGIQMKPRPFLKPAIDTMNATGLDDWFNEVIDDINLYFLR